VVVVISPEAEVQLLQHEEEGVFPQTRNQKNLKQLF